MENIYNTWWRKTFIALCLLLLIRETGTIDLSLYSLNSQKSTSSSTSRSNGAQIDPNVIDYDMGISIFDYIPFYKSRTFEGTIESGVGQQSPGAQINVTYKIDLTVKGLCSGHSFRELASQQLKQTVIQQAAINN